MRGERERGEGGEREKGERWREEREVRAGNGWVNWRGIIG